MVTSVSLKLRWQKAPPTQRFVGLSQKMYSIGLKRVDALRIIEQLTIGQASLLDVFPMLVAQNRHVAWFPTTYYSTKISTAELSSHPSYACQATSRKSRCQCLPPSSSDKAAARELRGHDWGIWLVSTWGMPMATHIENEDGVTRTFKEAWMYSDCSMLTNAFVIVSVCSSSEIGHLLRHFHTNHTFYTQIGIHCAA